MSFSFDAVVVTGIILLRILAIVLVAVVVVVAAVNIYPFLQ